MWGLTGLSPQWIQGRHEESNNIYAIPFIFVDYTLSICGLTYNLRMCSAVLMPRCRVEAFIFKVPPNHKQISLIVRNVSSLRSNSTIAEF